MLTVTLGICLGQLLPYITHFRRKGMRGLKPVRAFLFCFTSLPKPGIARVQTGVMIVNQIEPTLVQGTAVRFQFSKDQCRDGATIFGRLPEIVGRIFRWL
jgi:hypothetical protein